MPRVLTLLDVVEHFPPDEIEARIRTIAHACGSGLELVVIKVPVPGLLCPSHLGLKAILAAPAATATRGDRATPESLLETSLVLYRLGKFEESLAAAQRARDLRPDWDLAWNNICAAYNRLGRLDEAIAAGEKAVLLNPGNELARNNLKWAREQKALTPASPRR